VTGTRELSPTASPAGGEETGEPGVAGVDLDQYLTFGLEDEMFAVSVHQVREVLDRQRIAHVANAPALLLGMIDVRGSGIPVIDLKGKLALPSTRAEGEHTRIVVMEIGRDDERLVIGAITDAVYEVAYLPDEAIAPPPEFGARWQSAFMRGLARRGDRFVTLLDLERLFADADLAAARPLARDDRPPAAGRAALA
jgi:purine-binding chemotaxis protein CheW